MKRIFRVFSLMFYPFPFFRSEVEAEDVVDSDFSIDENDEVVSDHEDESGKRQKKAVVTKAYKVNRY